MEELRTEHETLQQAHRRLVAKDLMNSGILKDRYVADLFTRLQEAEWKLDVARKRACTWGYEMMVPLGRIDRGIQTQYAEVWAAEQQQQDVANQAIKQGGLGAGGKPAVQTSAAQPLGSGRNSSSGRRIHLDPIGDAGAGMSATVGLVSSPTTAAAGSPQAGDTKSNVRRKKPAFASHKNSSDSSTTKRPASADSDLAISCDNTAKEALVIPTDMFEAAEELIATGTIDILTAPAVLQLISSLYDAKAATDATALRNHRPATVLWDFVVQHLRRHSSKGSSGDLQNSQGDDGHFAATAALAQMLLSIQQHAGSCKEVAQFQHALLDSRQQSLLLAQSRQSCSNTQAVARPTSSHSDSQQSDRSSSKTVIKGSWGEVRLDNSKLLPVLLDPLALLPVGLSSVIERILLWPGMMALLGWVAEGHFLCGLEEDGLGKTLMDVQVWRAHITRYDSSTLCNVKAVFTGQYAN